MRQGRSPILRLLSSSLKPWQETRTILPTIWQQQVSSFSFSSPYVLPRSMTSIRSRWSGDKIYNISSSLLRSCRSWQYLLSSTVRATLEMSRHSHLQSCSNYQSLAKVYFFPSASISTAVRLNVLALIWHGSKPISLRHILRITSSISCLPVTLHIPSSPNFLPRKDFTSSLVSSTFFYPKHMKWRAYFSHSLRRPLKAEVCFLGFIYLLSNKRCLYSNISACMLYLSLESFLRSSSLGNSMRLESISL